MVSTLVRSDRSYDPTTGTFLSPDPLDGVDGETTVANPYHYTSNDPLNFTDPLGLSRLRDPDMGPCPPSYAEVTTPPSSYDALAGNNSGSYVQCEFRAPECMPSGSFVPPAVGHSSAGADASWQELSRARNRWAQGQQTDAVLWAVFEEPHIDPSSPTIMRELAEGARLQSNSVHAASSASGAARAAGVVSGANIALETVSVAVVLNDSIRTYQCTGDALTSIDMAAEGIGTAASGVAGAEIGATVGAAICTPFAPGAGTMVCGGLGAALGSVLGASLFQSITDEIRDPDCTFFTVSYCFRPPRVGVPGG